MKNGIQLNLLPQRQKYMNGVDFKLTTRISLPNKCNVDYENNSTELIHDDHQISNPFLRTQTLFKKHSRKQFKKKDNQKMTNIQNNGMQKKNQQSNFGLQNQFTQQIFDHNNMQDHKLYQNLLQGSTQKMHTDLSFFDSFGNIMNKQQQCQYKRIHTQPCQFYNHQFQIDKNSQSIFMLEEQKKPVAQFFLNLNVNKQNKQEQIKQDDDIDQLKKIMDKVKDLLEKKDINKNKDIQHKIDFLKIKLIDLINTISNSQNKELQNKFTDQKLVKRRNVYDNNKKVSIQVTKILKQPSIDQNNIKTTSRNSLRKTTNYAKQNQYSQIYKKKIHQKF